MLFWGAGATAAGYLTYGLTVYPGARAYTRLGDTSRPSVSAHISANICAGYELFKRLFFELAGPQLVLDYRVPLVLLAGGMSIRRFHVPILHRLRSLLGLIVRIRPNESTDVALTAPVISAEQFYSIRSNEYSLVLSTGVHARMITPLCTGRLQ